MKAQIYALDAGMIFTACVLSAWDAMVFWYILGGYFIFKTVLIYVLTIWRNEEIERRVGDGVERKLIEMSHAAQLQLARGDHSPIRYYH
jgi:hypothetical protein